MLNRIVHESGVVTYQSSMLARLGVRHAFSTRIGGVSPAPYESMNLGAASTGPSDTDSPTHIAENYRRLLLAVGVEDRTLAKVHQVHGPAVRRFDSSNLDPSCKADAVITDDPRLIASIRIADCVPVLVASRDGKAVGAIHSGWRGVVTGVIPATIAQLVSDLHVKPDQLVAAIGPCIGVDHFEVGPEVVQAFDDANLPLAVVRKKWPKPHVDLTLAVFEQLTRAGFPPDAIDIGNLCTFRDQADFFSHRRDQAVTGRMVALIASR